MLPLLEPEEHAMVPRLLYSVQKPDIQHPSSISLTHILRLFISTQLYIFIITLVHNHSTLSSKVCDSLVPSFSLFFSFLEFPALLVQIIFVNGVQGQPSWMGAGVNL